MSEMVHYNGKLKLVNRLSNETLEDQCKRLLEADEVSKYYSSYREMFEDILYDTYIINNDVIYEVLSKKRHEYDENIFIMKDNKDGTYDYEVMYYNGGCGFNEAVEEAFDNLINEWFYIKKGERKYAI